MTTAASMRRTSMLCGWPGSRRVAVRERTTSARRIRCLGRQMASFLVRALGLAPAQEDYFVDDGGVHEASINALRLAGITTGCRKGADHFCPTDAVSREQMASFLVRALGLAPVEPLAVHWRLELVVDRVAGGTTDLQAPAGDDRLFLVLKDGLIPRHTGSSLPARALPRHPRARSQGRRGAGHAGLGLPPELRR